MATALDLEFFEEPPLPVAVGCLPAPRDDTVVLSGTDPGRLRSGTRPREKIQSVAIFLVRWDIYMALYRISVRMTDELLEATVSVRGVIRDGRGETLVVRRSSDCAWELPGGRLGPREAVEAGLRREIEEETGLGIEVGETVHANAWQNAADDGRFAVYYTCWTDGRDVRLSEEHESFRWVAYDAAESMLSDPAARALRRARTEASAGLATRLPPSASSD